MCPLRINAYYSSASLSERFKSVSTILSCDSPSLELLYSEESDSEELDESPADEDNC